jgi:hypothetical protein
VRLADSPSGYAVGRSGVSSTLGASITRAMASASLAVFIAGTTAASAESWMPVQPGITSVHVYRSQKVLRIDGRTVKDESISGTREYAIRDGAERFGQPAMEIRQTLRTRKDPAAGVVTKTNSEYVEQTANAYRILGSELEWNGGRHIVRYPTPLAMLPERVQVGAQWHVGRGRLEDLELDIHGRILGQQDAQTPAGLFRRCLVVEYTRTIAGRADDRVRGPLEVLGGTSRTTVWYAWGVGEVMVKDETEMEVRIPGRGLEGTVTATVQSALKSRHSIQALPARRAP